MLQIILYIIIDIGYLTDIILPCKQELLFSVLIILSHMIALLR